MDHRDVSYLVYEATQARNERAVKRLVTALVIAIALMFISNAIWIYAWMQYDYVNEESTVTYSQDGKGFNNINTGNQSDFDLEVIDKTEEGE